jgi:hypothetical protein
MERCLERIPEWDAVLSDIEWTAIADNFTLFVKKADFHNFKGGYELFVNDRLWNIR